MLNRNFKINSSQENIFSVDSLEETPYYKVASPVLFHRFMAVRTSLSARLSIWVVPRWRVLQSHDWRGLLRSGIHSCGGRRCSACLFWSMAITSLIIVRGPRLSSCQGPGARGQGPGARGQGPGGQGASLSLTQCCFIIFAVGCGLCSSVFPHVVAR